MCLGVDCDTGRLPEGLSGTTRPCPPESVHQNCNAMTDLAVEEATIDAFIERSQRWRIRLLVGTKKGRVKFIGMLAHVLRLDERTSTRIPANQQNTGSILNLLRDKGAPDECYVISEDPEIDGTSQQLIHAMDRVMGLGSATIISCIPGVLGFYQGEDRNERYLLHSR